MLYNPAKWNMWPIMSRDRDVSHFQIPNYIYIPNLARSLHQEQNAVMLFSGRMSVSKLILHAIRQVWEILHVSAMKDQVTVPNPKESNPPLSI